MKWIDLHNVVLAVVFCAMSLLIARESHFRLMMSHLTLSVGMGVTTFVVLGGRILMHGMDLSRNGPEWKPYVAINLMFNTCVAGMTFTILALL